MIVVVNEGDGVAPLLVLLTLPNVEEDSARDHHHLLALVHQGGALVRIGIHPMMAMGVVGMVVVGEGWKPLAPFPL